MYTEETACTNPRNNDLHSISCCFRCRPYFFLPPALLGRAETGKPDSSKTAAASSQFAGSDSCKDCHAEEFKSYQNSSTCKDHAQSPRTGITGLRGVPRTRPGAYRCRRRCHQDHFIPQAKSEEASKLCLSCHQLGEEHANFLRSEHQKNNVGCLDCHSAHHPATATQLLKAKEPTLCYGCHLEKKPDFSMPFHHRVNEGLIQCSDCHNPHGGFLTKQLRSTSAQDTVCFKCHAEKAGPFMFEHAPVKTEGCVSCHTPHGSPNPRLLKRSQVNLLCLECHTFTVDSAAPGIPSFHNQAQKYQSCTLCHTQIHGSNFSPFFFK